MTQPKMSLLDYTFLIVRITYFIIVVDAYKDQVLSIALSDRCTEDYRQQIVCKS